MYRRDDEHKLARSKDVADGNGSKVDGAKLEHEQRKGV
jgi:hypothetical protein